MGSRVDGEKISRCRVQEEVVGILCRNGWIIISGYRCKMINLGKVLKVEESREVASFSGRI